MERAAEKGKAIVAAVEGVEKNWGSSVSGQREFHINEIVSEKVHADFANILPKC